MSKALTKCSALLDTSNFIHADECFTDGRKLYINEYGINAFVGVSGSALLTCYIESDMEVEKEIQNIHEIPGGFENLDILGLLNMQ